MQFNTNAQFDTSQVSDVRSSGGGGGGRISLPGGVGGSAGGLGVVGVIIFIVMQFLGGSGGGVGYNGANQANNAPAQVGGGDIASCKTDPNAIDRTDCRLNLVVNSVQQFWNQYLPTHTPQKVQYEPSITQLYSQGVNTGCGQATSAVGPFYCPNDKVVYIDPTFFDDMLTQLGADNVPFVQAYVVAHEYGHHIQDLLSVLSSSQDGATGANSNSVRIELQADCYAGVWANHATGTTDSSGVKIITAITSQDIQEGLKAAQAIGDDHIQSQGGGGVRPESFTHGTSKQRYTWFKLGIDSGDMAKCDTFSGDI
ncbi:MAG: neutral zinc metallopeptidase [Antricoccus sp.]